MIAVDSNFLPLLLSYKVDVPEDPNTGKPIENLQDRIDLLLERFDEQGETCVIPTPVLAEFLVFAAGDGKAYLDIIDRNPLFRIRGFDKRAAIELAAIRLKIQSSLSNKARKRQTKAETWAKISFDRQIVTIAKVNQVHTIFSDDKGVKTFAEIQKIKVVRTFELPQRPIDEQMTFEELMPAISVEDQKQKATDEGGPSESGSKT